MRIMRLPNWLPAVRQSAGKAYARLAEPFVFATFLVV